jgi:hypothetical protein
MLGIAELCYDPTHSLLMFDCGVRAVSCTYDIFSPVYPHRHTNVMQHTQFSTPSPKHLITLDIINLIGLNSEEFNSNTLAKLGLLAVKECTESSNHKRLVVEEYVAVAYVPHILRPGGMMRTISGEALCCNSEIVPSPTHSPQLVVAMPSSSVFWPSRKSCDAPICCKTSGICFLRGFKKLEGPLFWIPINFIHPWCRHNKIHTFEELKYQVALVHVEP